MRTACLVSCLLAIAAVPALADSKLTHYELENGLKVWLRPVAGSPEVGLAVVYDVGEDHDPEGKSGLSHLVEHLYVTSAAGTTPPRTAEEMMQAYPRRWNAQTGARYTVIAFMAPPADLPREIADAAARMSDLQITEHEVVREQRRMAQELSNMFDGFPGLVAFNRARERVRPSPEGGRKGGNPEDVMGLTLEDAQRWHGRYYKPTNARLVLTGGFDVEEARKLVAKHFAPLPSGDALPAAREPGDRRLGSIDVHRARGVPPHFPGHVCVAYPAPTPGSKAYAPFLVLVCRLFAARMRGGLSDGVEAQYLPIDAPELLYVSGPMQKDETPADAEARIRKIVTGAAAKPVTAADRGVARMQLAQLLGTMPLTDALLQGSAYALAFGIARRDQLGIDGLALGEAILAVDEEAFRAMATVAPRPRDLRCRRGPGAPVIVHIDGSEGEGGGQVLRSALALSLATGTPFHLSNIRANRSRPGLRPQHVASVRAAARIGNAEAVGDGKGSRELTFTPKGLESGDYHFDVGTAGSAVLVLQTVLPPLLTATRPLDDHGGRRHTQPLRAALRVPGTHLSAADRTHGSTRRLRA